MPKMTVERAVALKREIGRQVNGGTDDDWADWGHSQFKIAIASEMIDAIIYAERAREFMADDAGWDDAGWNAGWFEDRHHALADALMGIVERMMPGCLRRAIEQAAADADVELTEIEAAVDEQEVNGE